MSFISPRKKLLQSVDWDEQDGALPGGDDWIAVSQPASPELYAIKRKQRELLSPAQREPGSFYPTDSFDLQGQQKASPTVSPRATGGGAGGGKAAIMPPRSAMATPERTAAAPNERPRTASARLEYLSLPKRRAGGGGGGGGRRSSTQIMAVGEDDEPTTTTTTTTTTRANIVHGTPHKGSLFMDDNPVRPQDDEDVFSRGGGAGAGAGGSRGSIAGAARQRPHTALHVTSSKTASATRPSTATSRVSTWAPEREYLAHFTQRQGRVAGKKGGGQEAGNANLVWMKNTGLVHMRSNIATRRLEEKNLPWPPKGVAMSRREVEAAASQSRKHQLATSRARLCARTGKTGRGGAMMIQAMIPDEERRTSLSGRMIPRPVQGKWGLMEMLTYQPAVKPPPVGRRMDMSGLRTSKTSYLHRHLRDLKAAGSEAVMSLHHGSAAEIRRARSSVGLAPPGWGEGWDGAWRAPPPPRGWGVDIVEAHAGERGSGGGGGGGGGEDGESEEGFGCASRPLSAKSLPLEDGSEMPTVAELLRADLSADSGSRKQFEVFVPSPLPSPMPTMDGQDLKRIMSTTGAASEIRVVSPGGGEGEALAENCLLANDADWTS